MERYNIKNEEYKQYLEGLLLANLPIEFYGLKMRQMKVKEILELGEPIHNSMIKPFTINVDLIDNEQIKKNGFTTLDVIYVMNNDFLENAIKLIKIIFDLEDECVSTMFTPKPEIVISKGKDILCINGIKFEELKHIVLKMFNTREINKDDIEKDKGMCFQDEEYSNRFSKLFKGRARKKAKEKTTTTSQIYNLVVHSQENIDYNNVLNWTLYQMVNTYKKLGLKESHNFNMRYYSSGMASFKAEDIKTLYQQLSQY